LRDSFPPDVNIFGTDKEIEVVQRDLILNAAAIEIKEISIIISERTPIAH
jgi:hypothetical protein